MSPLMDVANATKSIPLLFTFLLGIVGTLAPYQLTGNISAITLYPALTGSKTPTSKFG
ncbi:cytochrome C biogenesis protein [Bacillus cereus]|nr:cytochrome C biogenesis protein [Bacillus cereus]